MNLSFYFCFLRPHFHNSVVIVFFVFEPSKAFMTSLGNGYLILLEKTETFRNEMIFHFY